MNTRHWIFTVSLITSAVLAAAPLSAKDPNSGNIKVHHHRVYTTQDETAVALKNVEEQAYDLNDHAVTMQAGTRMETLDRDFFVSQMGAIRHDVNKIGKEIARLEALSTYETSSERDTISRVKPVLEKIAQSADANLQYLNNKPEELNFPEYRKLTNTLQDETGKFWTILHDSVTMTNVEKREQSLRKDIGQVQTSKN